MAVNGTGSPESESTTSTRILEAAEAGSHMARSITTAIRRRNHDMSNLAFSNL
jgi:hypothetical protein